MKIRTAERTDIDALVAFNQAMALETEDKVLSDELLRPGVAAVFDDAEKGFYVVAAEGDQAVAGLLVTREWSDWRNGWFWWIQSVYVLPEYRGRGIYKLMYEFVKRRAEENGGVCGFRLYVERENTRAQAVYEKLGMEPTNYLMYEEETKNRGLASETPVLPKKIEA